MPLISNWPFFSNWMQVYKLTVTPTTNKDGIDIGVGNDMVMAISEISCAVNIFGVIIYIFLLKWLCGPCGSVVK